MRQQVYRMENAEGNGPFQATFNETTTEATEYFYELPKALGWLDYYENEPSSFETLFEGIRGWRSGDVDHPHHMTDVPPPDDFDQHTWKVGCRSLEQLLHWFPNHAWAYLASQGFELTIYDCEYVHFGEYQVLFCVDDAVLVERRPLT